MELLKRVAATLLTLVGLASATCTPKCLFNELTTNFDPKEEEINDYQNYDPYKMLNSIDPNDASETISLADAISFSYADLTPKIESSDLCPVSFKTESYTSPGGLGSKLKDAHNHTHLYNKNSPDWDFKVHWKSDDSVYDHPVLAAMLLIGEDDNVIYASKFVYFTRSGITGYSSDIEGIEQTKELLLPDLCDSIFLSSLTWTATA